MIKKTSLFLMFTFYGIFIISCGGNGESNPASPTKTSEDKIDFKILKIQVGLNVIVDKAQSLKNYFYDDGHKFPYPFLITTGLPYNYPYRGTSYPSGNSIVVIEERWVDAVKLPFESHFYVTVLKDSKKISGPTLLFPDSTSYFYNPKFVETNSGVFLYFNAFNPTTNIASFERSQFSNEKFSEPEPLILNEDLTAQYRPWIFASVSNDNRVVLTYEWKDTSTKKNNLKMTDSQDGIHFLSSKNMAIGAMARNEFFQDGTQIFTYQNGDPTNMIDFFSLSKDGSEWTSFQPISNQKDLHDVTPFRRLDGNIDLYYVSSGSDSTLSIFRRSVDKIGRLGLEEKLSEKATGSVMQPHPTRLKDGSIFLVFTKEVTEQMNYELWAMYVEKDAPTIPN